MQQRIFSPENPEGVIQVYTTEQEAEVKTFSEAQKVKIQAEQDAKTAKATAQASGNTKLLALGLSQAEATALTGYTPSED
ncbi:hypothetical protein N9I13_00290 [bacterium]|nr:hypothetical protein [bacterium]